MIRKDKAQDPLVPADSPGPLKKHASNYRRHSAESRADGGIVWALL